MDGQQLQAIIGTVAFIVAAVVGVKSSVWLTRRYRKARSRIEARNRPVLLIIVFASWLITAAAIWIGTFSALRLTVNLVLPWTPPITLGFATAIVFIPYMFKWAIKRVSDADDEEDTI